MPKIVHYGKIIAGANKGMKLKFNCSITELNRKNNKIYAVIKGKKNKVLSYSTPVIVNVTGKTKIPLSLEPINYGQYNWVKFVLKKKFIFQY